MEHFINFHKRAALGLAFVFVLFSGYFFVWVHYIFAATFTVDSSLDTADVLPGDGTCDDGGGNCTLRAAIDEANAFLGEDVITFSGAMTISTGTSYSIDTPMNIDATTGAVSTCFPSINPGVDIVFTSLGAQIEVLPGADGTTIKGLGLSSSAGSGGGEDAGISISADDITVACNVIGLDSSGIAAPFASGVDIYENTGTIIGGANPEDGNVISGNSYYGVAISSDSLLTASQDVLVQYNFIGTSMDGMSAAANGVSGIFIPSGGSDNIQIMNNVVSGNENGISIGATAVAGFTNMVIQGNKIGVDKLGTSALPNIQNGINLESAFIEAVVIGGGGVGEGNIISGNGAYGILIDSVTSAFVVGNYIGVDQTGTVAIPNGGNGIDIAESAGVVIGGSVAGEGNIISGNLGRALQASTVDGLTIQGNLIGVDITGLIALGNEENGIALTGVTNAVIGGASAEMRNIISGQGNSPGILITSTTSGVSILGNYIGVGADGTSDLFNSIGIAIVEADDIVIGGVAAGEGNIIGNNAESGVLVLGGATDVSIMGNSISGNAFGISVQSNDSFPDDPLVSISQNNITGNALIGIKLLEGNDVEGPNENDLGDADTGPNNYLNYPEITSVYSGNDTVTYSLDVPVGYYQIEFFKNPTNGLAEIGNGEGEIYVGSEIITSGGVVITGQEFLVGAGIDLDDVITATATECADDVCATLIATSEFSTSVDTIDGTTQRVGSSGSAAALGGVAIQASNPTVPKTVDVVPVNPSSDIPKLPPGKLFKFSVRDASIKILQAYLNSKGFIVASIGPGSRGYETDYFGPLTRAAVIAFQKAMGLVPDGIVGPATINKMK